MEGWQEELSRVVMPLHPEVCELWIKLDASKNEVREDEEGNK